MKLAVLLFAFAGCAAQKPDVIALPRARLVFDERPKPAPQILASDLDEDSMFAIGQGIVKGGVVIVSYDGHAFRVLSQCLTEPAEYETKGLPLRETITKVSLETTVVVRVRGQETASIEKVRRSSLQGKDEACTGATHFVSRMALGALSLTSTAPNAKFTRRIGDLDACLASDTSALSPPMTCRSPLAFELIPISEQ